MDLEYIAENEQNQAIFEEHIFDDEIVIQILKRSENLKKICFFIPCFNYRKDIIKFFLPMCEEDDSIAFISFDVSVFHAKKIKLTIKKYLSIIKSIIKWAKKAIKNIPIYILAESWASGIGYLFLEENSKYLEKLIICNFPNGTKYQELFQFKNFNEFNIIKKNQESFENNQNINYAFVYSEKLKDLTIKDYIDKILNFKLLNVEYDFSFYLDESHNYFEKIWKKMINSSLMNKVFFIESSQNILRSEYLMDLYKLWKNNIKFVKGHHLLLMCIHQNSRLFRKIKKIISD